MEELINKFKLPSYIKGKSFADASKAIMKRFEGREDSEAVNTQKALLGRLRDAQEYVKQMSETPETGASQAMPDATQMQGAPMQNQNFLGGALDAAGAAGATEGAAGAAGSSGPGVEGYLQAAQGAVQIGQDIFGKTGIDTSGASSAEYTSGAGQAGMGALKGAAAGQAFGPYGMAAGAVLGGVGGLIKGGKMNRDAETALRNNTYAESNATNNRFEKGGKMNSYGHGGPHDGNDEIDYNVIPKENKYSSILDSVGLKSEGAKESGLLGLENIKTPLMPDTSTPTSSTPTEKSNGPNTYLSQALRYAPAAANLGQLLSLKKPGDEGLNRINARYKENLTDEEAIQNLVKEQTAGTREAIVGASGGSGSTARANLIANSLNSNKALSDAYMNAVKSNQNENRTGQQFNLGVANTNLQQSNAENDINARNRGNYDTQKSKLISQLGNDVGAIGKEELFKKYPELMGADYSWLGKYINGNKTK